MSKRLQDFIDEANVAFQDSSIQRSHDELEGTSALRRKELLASLVAATIEDLYAVSSGDESNLNRIATGLQFVVDDLRAILRSLQNGNDLMG